jgi:hypothetical protein
LAELDEWNALAPLAFAMGTLTTNEVFALRDLCQLRVLRDKLLRTIEDDGHIVRDANYARSAHPLLSRIVALSARVDAGMARFKLAPFGKPVEAAAQTKEPDPFAEFDAVASGEPEDTRH